MRHGLDKSWEEWKRDGGTEYENGNYKEALDAFQNALKDCSMSDNDRQRLLSNSVACRLKLHQDIPFAISEAQQCIALNKNWSKGHVRLASAYIANGQSNDACNSLQRAIQLDPTNSTFARQLLRAELQRRNHNQHASPSAPPYEPPSDPPSAPPPEPSAPPMEEVPPSPPTANFYFTNNQNYHFSSSNTNTDHTPPIHESFPVHNTNDNNNSMSWMEWFQIQWSKLITFITMKIHNAISYYQNLTPDGKTVVQVIVGILLLYVAFGGRFGLTSTNDQHHSSYTSSDDYYQYDKHKQQNQQRYSSSSYGPDRRNSYHRNDDDHYSYNYRTNSNNGYSSSYYHFHLFDGSLPSMIILGMFGYICHAYFRINPAHAIYILRLLTSGGGGRVRFGRRAPNMYRR